MAQPNNPTYTIADMLQGLAAVFGATDDSGNSLKDMLGAKLVDISGLALMTALAVVLYHIFHRMIDALVKASNTFTNDTAGQAANISEGIGQIASAAEQALKNTQADRTKTRVKIPKPGAFSGNPEDVEPFIISIRAYCIYEEIDDLATRLMLFTGLVHETDKKLNKSWANSQYRLISDWQTQIEIAKRTGTALPGNIYESWEDFEANFRNFFCLLETKEVAQTKIRDLEMGKGSCDHYTTTFNSYATPSGFDAEYLLVKYKEGLNSNLRMKITQMNPIPRTLEQWKNAALNIDREFRKELELTKLRDYKGKERAQYNNNNHSGHNNRYKHNNGLVPRRDPNAMDVDATTTGQTNCKICDGDHWMRNCPDAVCGQCRQKGHIAINCPKRAPQQTRNVRAVEREERNKDFS